MRFRDLAERVFWTGLSAFLGVLSGNALLSWDVGVLEAALAAGLGGVVNAILVIGRWRLSVLPDPGEGLPGLPTD